MRVLPPALETHRAFLRRMERYFGLSGVEYRLDPAVVDIAAERSRGLILIGRKWHRAGAQEQRKRLTHEALHLWGLPHSAAMRSLGYYSRPERDRWTRLVYRDILAGTPRFRPAKFGLGRRGGLEDLS